MRRTTPFIALLPAALLTCASCTNTTIVEPFVRPPDALVEQSYRSPGADFSIYTKLMTSPLEIYYPDDGPAPSEADLVRLRQTFRDAFLTELTDDYEIVTEPGPDVLHVIGQIVDLKIVGPIGSFQPTGRLSQLVTKGQLTLLIELRDSVSGRVLARAGETEQGDSTSFTDEETSWAEVERAAARWAGMFRAFLDENLGGGGGS